MKMNRLTKLDELSFTCIISRSEGEQQTITVYIVTGQNIIISDCRER